MNDAFAVLTRYYKDWTGIPSLEYHAEPGDDPSVWKCSSEKAESQQVGYICRDATRESKSVLVLVPKHVFVEDIAKELRRNHIPFVCDASSMPDDLRKYLVFLDWLADPTDSFLARLVIDQAISGGGANVPGWKRNKRTKPETEVNRAAAERVVASLWESVTRTRNLYGVLKGYDGEDKLLLSLRDLLRPLLERYKRNEADKGGEFARESLQAVGVWKKPTNIARDLKRVSAMVSTTPTEEAQPVKVITMRKAKGLEADVAIMVGLEDDITPGTRPRDLEEDARLFYVSMTRAKKELYLLHCQRRSRGVSFGRDMTDRKRSRFLDAIGRDSVYKALVK